MTREEFQQLIEQLVYIDHEENTDVAVELTEVISHAKAEGLDAAEIVELVRGRAKILALTDEQARLVQELCDRLPAALAS